MIPRRITIYFLMIVFVLLGTGFTSHSVLADPGPGTCQSSNVPVGLGPGQPDQYTIYGELCNPAGGPSQTVQLLVAGATYGHVYWDFPYQPQTYSYVRALNAAGYSTFNIDRIGIGNSSHPLSALVSKDADAYSIHQVIQGLRTGTIGGQTFAHVLLVGHSLGSLTSWVEAGTYKDVDGVIITGLTHHFNTVQITLFTSSFYPAQLDPRFAGKGLDTGYLTTRPGTRGNDFYYAPGADPQAIATDEATKETVTSGELASFAPSFINGISERITVPVFVVMGQQDALFCAPLATNCSSNATLQQAESPFYAPQAQLQVAVIPNAGHDINLHLAAPTWFAASTTWALQHVAP